MEAKLENNNERVGKIIISGNSENDKFKELFFGSDNKNGFTNIVNVWVDKNRSNKNGIVSIKRKL